jgi:hypothetical protein
MSALIAWSASVELLKTEIEDVPGSANACTLGKD